MARLANPEGAGGAPCQSQLKAGATGPHRSGRSRPSPSPARAAAAPPTDASPALQRPPVRDEINSFQEGCCRSCRKSSSRQGPQTAGPARSPSHGPDAADNADLDLCIVRISFSTRVFLPAAPRAPRRPHPRASLHPHRECTTLETSRCARPSYPPLARRLSRRQALPTGCLSRQGGSRGTGVGLGPCPPRRPAASLVPTTGSRARPSASTHACSRRYDDGDIPEEQARVKVRRLSRPAAVNSTPQRIYPQ